MDYTYGETLLKIDHVSLSYNRPILRDVNAEIKKINVPGRATGQVVSFLGFSGVGKTQLLRMIAGLKNPDAGKVLINTAGGMREVQAGDVGVVAQNYPLFAHRTILGNLMIPAQDKDKVIQHLALYKLEDHANNYPAELSGGQRQRVAILQMILSGSNLILMDEPFSGLDMLMLEKTCQVISDMSDHGGNKTIVIVTHDITSAASISDHIFLLGHEHDAAGNPVPGAQIVETYDLLERGLCYRPGIITEPEFLSFVAEVKNRFRTLC